MQVSFHQIGDNVDVVVASASLRSWELNQLNNIVMFKEFQKLDFSENSFRVNEVFKCIWNLLA